MARRQQAGRLRAGLGAPSDRERDVRQCGALEGRSYAELARWTGVHPAALESRAFRARRQPARILGAALGLG